ncbi:hypothetical protein WME73_33680 [Sorangium sp. So ce302]|uniref:hypothetical protein n=1 Tax=Sorangium sp. So ce302 TaxID=3133297 RepID=UPI003F625434
MARVDGDGVAKHLDLRCLRLLCLHRLERVEARQRAALERRGWPVDGPGCGPPM